MHIRGRCSFPAYALPGGSPRCVQVCIVFTDGDPTEGKGEKEKVRAASKAWAGIGATVFAVGIGGEPTPEGKKRL